MKSLLQAVIFTLFSALFAALFSANVSAHGLHLFAQFDGQQISGKAYYSDQTPAAETYVEAVREGEEEPIVYSKTDKQGNFVLPTTEKPPLKVVLFGMEGHRAEVELKAEIAPLTSGNAADLQALRMDIDQLKNKLYWRDIIGGVGYIFGLFGLIALYKNRKTEGKN